MKRITFLFCIALLSCCSGFSPTGGPAALPRLVTHVSGGEALVGLNSVLVLPLHFEENARSATGLCGSLYNQLVEAAQAELSIRVLSDNLLVSRCELAQAPGSFEDAVKAARKVDADAVLVTTLHNFVERNGSRVGTHTPAALSFSMVVYKLPDQQEIWRASYHFQDRALSENILLADKRLGHPKDAGWRDVKELIRDGFHDAFGDLARQRISQFS